MDDRENSLPGRRGGIGRRRAIRLLAAAAGAGLPALARPGAAATLETDLPLWRWRGTALGAEAELAIAHPDPVTAKRLVALALAEVERLEAIFSLYRPDSALVALNARGRLERPPPELVELLALAQAWSRRSAGAFDVTVQPLWALYSRHFARPDADPDGPPPRALAEAVRRVGYRGLDVAPAVIRLTRPGMAVTLNGIAQGYITDRVADLLHAEGLDRVLVCLGEARGLGRADDGEPWRVGLAAPEPLGGLLETVDLTDAAVATSSVSGLRFDRTGRFHHLLDPLSGGCARGYRSVSVVAQRACHADALSTALTAAGRLSISAADLRRLGVRRIVAMDGGGQVEDLV